MAHLGASALSGGTSWQSEPAQVCQNLPENFQEELESFRAFVQHEIGYHDHDVSASHIINMDEIPLTFDIPMERSITKKCEKSVAVKTGHKKCHFTVVLACCVDGTKLPLVLIFKRKAMSRDPFLSAIIVQANVKGWVYEILMSIWLDRSFSRRPDGFFNAKKSCHGQHEGTDHRLHQAENQARELHAGHNSWRHDNDIAATRHFHQPQLQGYPTASVGVVGDGRRTLLH